MIAKTNIYSFFRQINLKFNKYIYYGLKKLIKPYISIFLDDLMCYIIFFFFYNWFINMNMF